MIRCGQMMLANAMVRSQVEAFKVGLMMQNVQQLDKFISDDIYRSEIQAHFEKDILVKFFDSGDDSRYPFSIKNIVDEGADFNKEPGDWFGTNSIAQVLRQLNNKHQPYSVFEICAFNDGIMYLNDIIELASVVIDVKKKYNIESSPQIDQNE